MEKGVYFTIILQFSFLDFLWNTISWPPGLFVGDFIAFFGWMLFFFYDVSRNHARFGWMFIFFDIFKNHASNFVVSVSVSVCVQDSLEKEPFRKGPGEMYSSQPPGLVEAWIFERFELDIRSE